MATTEAKKSAISDEPRQGLDEVFEHATKALAISKTYVAPTTNPDRYNGIKGRNCAIFLPYPR